MHIFFVYFYFYWLYPWLDLLMHAIGGFLVGLLALMQSGKTMTRRQMILRAIVGSLAVGILWEIFEYETGFALATAPNYIFDTVTDLILDGVGGALAGVFLNNKKI